MTPIRLGMVGGGQGAFIGAVHRIAARMDGHYQLVAGALSSDPARAHASAEELGIDAARSYDSFSEMASRKPPEKMGLKRWRLLPLTICITPQRRRFWRRAFM